LWKKSRKYFHLPPFKSPKLMNNSMKSLFSSNHSKGKWRKKKHWKLSRGRWSNTARRRNFSHKKESNPNNWVEPRRTEHPSELVQRVPRSKARLKYRRSGGKEWCSSSNMKQRTWLMSPSLHSISKNPTMKILQSTFH
jgi:hypothetical protein